MSASQKSAYTVKSRSVRDPVVVRVVFISVPGHEFPIQFVIPLYVSLYIISVVKKSKKLNVRRSGHIKINVSPH